MATIVFGSYMVRYPLGGNLSWAMQFLVGFKELGHDVYFVEKYAYAGSCYDPEAKKQSDDCSYGVKVVSALLKRFGLENKWCFVEMGDIYHGLNKNQINDVFKRADIYIDSGAHGAWEEEAAYAKTTVLIDGDPGFTQFQMENAKAKGHRFQSFHHYFTNGRNVGAPGNMIPTANITWRHLYSPVNVSLFSQAPVNNTAPYGTIMNWTSYSNVQYNGAIFGQKNIEFGKFMPLPKLVTNPMEIAASAMAEEDCTRLKESGWSVKQAQEVTYTYDSFVAYLSYCRGEFSVCKHGYVATRSGWFSDKSAAYLASGRPVILQDTGFSDHLPTGEGLFAVNTIEDAVAAIEAIEGRYTWHSNKARELASAYLDAKVSLKNFLQEIGI